MPHRLEVHLIGDGFTQQQALDMKAEITTYASTYNLKGSILIIEPL